MSTYVVTLQCADGPGIVLAASTAIVSVGGNILENDQFTDPDTAQFCMRTRFETDVTDASVVRAALEGSLERFGPTLGVRHEASRYRALVMVSRADHCLAELFHRHDQGDLPLDLVAVVSNHVDCAALVARHHTPFHHVAVSPDRRAEAESTLRGLLVAYDVDFVVLARYMQVLSPALCEEYAGRIVNIHHSFLPGFKGARPYHQAYERGVKLIGATSHFVTSDLDEGPIIEQDVVRVTHARDAAALASLGRDVESRVLARAMRLVAEDRVALVGSRTVIFSQ